MTNALRQLEPGEQSAGVHRILAKAEDGTVLAEYECPCDWCVMWRAQLPTIRRAIGQIDAAVLGDGV